MKAKINKLTPYLNFDGNCEEALNYYKDILGGTVDILARYDNSAIVVTENFKNKVLHGRLTFGDLELFASDIFSEGHTGKNRRNIALSLEVPDVENGKKLFSRLAEAGKVGVPFEKQYWGGWHGNVTDKYGTRWMVNS